jgi:phosphoribosyl 1,2-cyclic phosphodiesterase
MKAIDYRLERVVGAIVTHRHGDHSYLIPKMLKYCIPIYSCADVAGRYDEVVCLQPKTKYKIGNFIVQPLVVEHDVENYAYIISHVELGKLVYAVDCVQFPYKIANTNHWVIEANHDEEIIIDNMCDNIATQSASENHLSINQTIEVLNNNLCDATRTIVLAHLSDGNSNASEFLDKTRTELGFENVFIADKGLIIDINK